jgi:hypothetical protein
VQAPEVKGAAKYVLIGGAAVVNGGIDVEPILDDVEMTV